MKFWKFVFWLAYGTLAFSGLEYAPKPLIQLLPPARGVPTLVLGLLYALFMISSLHLPRKVVQAPAP